MIVESPAKAKTINRYLGPGYAVKACLGHVRDLPANEMGIDLDHDFEPVYTVDAGRKKLVSQLAKAARKAECVYLATDLDREGEAIAWHLAAALDLPPEKTRRVVFNEITKSAIRQAFARPHGLDMDKVNAQQARRLLDRIVGYQLSPLLWKKVAKGLSAGRVQSVAARLIVEREWQIRQFVPTESWRITGCFATQPEQADELAARWEDFLEAGADPDTGRTVKERNAWLSDHACLQAELVKLGGKPFGPTNVDQCRAVAEALGFLCEEVEESLWEDYAEHGLKTIDLNGRTDRNTAPAFVVADIQTKRTRTKPPAPFITATLQQAASTQLGFSTSRTMRIAQELYEGVDLGNSEGPVGLITYMRTDSTALSAESISQVRGIVKECFGQDYLPDKPNRYGRAKRAQEAHEAIRPTDATYEPGRIKARLTVNQYKLYDLIWRRFVACQMTPAQWDGTTVLISAPTARGEVVFKATGRRLAFDGYQRVMSSGPNSDLILPELNVGAAVVPLQIDPQQKFSSPPPRYTEASLVKDLEAEGIGRPSTYAAIINTIQDRGYVEQIDRRFYATDKGQIVTEKLIEHFPKIMDLKFTSYMEDELDKIEEAHLDWVHVLREFYEPFKELLNQAHAEMEPVRAEPSEYKCPKCGKEMVYRHGKNGRFLSCSGYPDCRVSRNIDSEGNPIEEIVADAPCPVCGKPMILRRSRRGPFLGCRGYPECTHTLPADENGVPLKKVEAEAIKETCPECASPMTVKWSRGKSFLGCTAYPKCKATTALPEGVYVEKPKPKDAGVNCDKCGRPMVIRTSRRGPFLSCSGFPRCRNAMPMDKLDHLKALAAAGKIPEAPAKPNGRLANGEVPKTKDGKVDYEAMGPSPPGFAWTRTGRPVVEDWPEDGLNCPECGGEMALKIGRFGPYWGCTAYPKCRFIANMRGQAKKRGEKEFPPPS